MTAARRLPCPACPSARARRRRWGHFLALAERLGFAVKNYDNYIGEAVFGSGPDLAVLCHLDVVPAGEGWTHPPFGGAIEGGRLYGRGTMDDKGPAIVCLYCMKALKDAGFAPPQDGQTHRRLQRRERLGMHRALQPLRAHAGGRGFRRTRTSPSSMRKRASFTFPCASPLRTRPLPP